MATKPLPRFGFSEDPLSLLPRRKPQIFEKDQTIYGPDDPADSLMLVVDGGVKISRVGDNGRETILDFASAESFVGFASILGDATRGEMATAMERATVMEWPIGELRALMIRTPELGPALMRAITRKLVEADQRIESLANDHIPRRLVKALLRLGERFGEPKSASQVIRIMPLTHEMLARHVGTSREIVTQHMSQLRRKGLLDYSRTGLEFDPAKLQLQLENIR